MQHLLARILFRGESRASLKYLDGVIKDADMCVMSSTFPLLNLMYLKGISTWAGHTHSDFYEYLKVLNYDLIKILSRH